MLIAQITDMHIEARDTLAYGVVDTGAYLERCVAHLNALSPRPDLVLGTGDLVHSGTPAQYARLRELLRPLAMPLFLIPGNHDDRALLRETFADHAYLAGTGEFLQYTVETHPLRLIALDTLVPGEGGGNLCAARLEWLAGRLAEQPERPTVIFMHHPPFSTGIAFMDALGLEGTEGLAAVVSRHGSILAILCGHLHRSIQTLWAGTMVSCAPSPAHQVNLDLRDEERGEFILEPPACCLHLWREGQGLVTHLSYIGAFDGPYPFRAKPAAAE